MPSLCVYNSLLRIDGQSGVPLSPRSVQIRISIDWFLSFLPITKMSAIGAPKCLKFWKIKLCSERPKETKVVTLPYLLKQMEN